MDFYNSKKNVDAYIKESIGFDGEFLINILQQYLKPNSTVLELGMGEGKDLQLLSKIYKTTGSDKSFEFISRYNKKHPKSKALLLDAVSLETTAHFDCIYSNKAMIHLTREDFKESILKQYQALNPGGLLLHSFWYGDSIDVFTDFFSVNYNDLYLSELFSKKWEILKMERYQEMEAKDSIYILAKKI